MGKRIESFQKNSLKPNAAPHNNASWCTDTGGFLEHSVGKPVLQGACPPEDNSAFLGGNPLLFSFEANYAKLH